MLDSEYRLYFNEPNVAENGVFIKTTEDGFWDGWTRVDNLQLTQLGTYCYKFGVLPNSNTCYIQFPEDIADLLNKKSTQALNIKYVTSSGAKGNIKSSFLKTFLDDIVVSVPNSDGTTSEVTVTGQLAVIQSSGTVNGADPESVNDAYKNYKRTVGTFDTLVTVKDYENAIFNAKTADVLRRFTEIHRIVVKY